MSKPELQERMQAALGLADSDFGYYATDLYVLAKPGVWEWLQANYKFPNNVKRFTGAAGSDWAGKPALDIPFAGQPAQGHTRLELFSQLYVGKSQTHTLPLYTNN